MKKVILLLCVFLGYIQNTFSQNDRITTTNSIGWYTYLGTFKISNSIDIHTEYQWRREAFIKNWQQGLLRFGLNYQINPRIAFRAGYAWAETYSYGEIPLNGFGRDFTEHRIFEMLQLMHKEGSAYLTHRFMLEQRFVGTYSSENLMSEDAFPFSSRMRYMFRLQLPLTRNANKSNAPYLVLYDEIFVGFGKNVKANIFDQNRIGVLLGYRFNSKFRIEGGFINQIAQYGREINNQNVFQNNSGFIMSTAFNFDLTKQGIK